MNTSIFLQTVGNSSKARVMEYLLTCRGLPVHQSDVIRNSMVSKMTVMKIWQEMIQNNLLRYERTIGRAKLYTLNTKNPTMKKLIGLYNVCLKQEAEAGIPKTLVTMPA